MSGWVGTLGSPSVPKRVDHHTRDAQHRPEYSRVDPRGQPGGGAALGAVGSPPRSKNASYIVGLTLAVNLGAGWWAFMVARPPHTGRISIERIRHETGMVASG
jgi:hypothetical protein